METGNEATEDPRKRRILDEALKGERMVAAIAEEEGINRATLGRWLEEHYAANPDDPRRHRIVRESERFKRDDTPVAAAREDEMSNGTPIEPEKRAEILARVARIPETGESKRQIAKEYGIHESTITWWQKHPQEGERAMITAARKAAVFADLQEGKLGWGELKEKHGLANATLAKYRDEWKEQRRRDNIAKARKAKAEKMKDPEYREQLRQKHWKNRAAQPPAAPPMPEQLSLSPLPAPVSSPPPRLPMAGSGVGVAINLGEMGGEMFRECVEERATLRGMVKLLEREAEAMRRKIEAYRRHYGEINT